MLLPRARLPAPLPLPLGSLAFLRTSKDHLSSKLSFWISVQPERENRINNSLIDHVVEWRHDIQYSKTGEAHTKNTIKP